MGSFFSSIANPSFPSEEDSPIVAIHSQDTWNTQLQAHKESNQLMVIDFTASWCGPCRVIEPIVKALAVKFKDAVFAKIDVDELPDVAQKWGVQAMPTFVLVKGGEEIDRVVGAHKDELEAKIRKFSVVV